MIHHTSGRLFLLAGLLLSACEAPVASGLSSAKDKTEGEPTEAPSSNRGTPASSGSAAPAGAPASNAPPGMPYETPTEHVTISDASEVWSTAPAYKGESPGARAKDRHSFDVTGKDCLSCHDGSGAAPSFAFGGTIANGKTWEWAPWNWTSGLPSLGWGGWGQSTANGVWGGWGSYGQGTPSGSGSSGEWQSGKKGWPSDRTEPSPNTEVRIIGADGLVFETTTDQDGNYWYKSKTALKQPANTGIRRGSFLKALKSNGSACASCHENGEASSPGRIWTWDGGVPTWPWTH